MYLPRALPSPYEEQLGGEEAHHTLASAFAASYAGARGFSPKDCYAAMDQLPLPDAADLFLDRGGRPLPPPDGLAADARDQFVAAARLAERIRHDALELGVYFYESDFRVRSPRRACS